MKKVKNTKRNNKNRNIFMYVFIFIFGVISLCSDEKTKTTKLEQNSSFEELDINFALIGTPTPLNGQAIGTSIPITISFNETVDITSTVINGTMQAESDGGIWTSSVSTNDTLTISPGVTWTPGSARTLTIDCNDMAGNPYNLSLSYDIIDQVLYVRTDGVDTAPGSQTQPKKTIKAAIDAALSEPSVTEIHVAEGIYEVSYQTGTHVNVSSGIMLLGGYSPVNWSLRDTAVYETVIQDTSVAGSNNTVLINNSEGKYTLIDGFTVKAGSGYSSTAVSANSAGGGPVTISNNNLVLGTAMNENYGAYLNSETIFNNNTISGSSYNIVYAVYNSGNASKIQNNTITLGTGTMGDAAGSKSYGIFTNQSAIITGNLIDPGSNELATYGIYNINSASTIMQNTIKGGTSTMTYGIYNDNSRPGIVNNYISGGSGSGTNTYGIYNTGADSSSFVVYNNTIHTGSGNSDGINGLNDLKIINNIIFANWWDGTDYCLREANATDDPSLVQNNNFFGCNKVYRDWDAGCTTNEDGDSLNSTCTLNEMEALTDITVSGNISEDPIFVDHFGGDWRLNSTSPVAVTEGGLDGLAVSWLFTSDAAGTVRTGDGTTGWSMGAHEIDGAVGGGFGLDSYEYDSTFDDANNIIISGAAQDHTVHHVSDADYIKFTVTFAADYDINIINVSAGLDASLELYDAAFAQVGTTVNAAGAGVGESIAAVALTPQTYYVKVTSVSTGSYQVQVQIVPDVNEVNDDFASASVIVADAAAQSLNLHDINDVDFLTLIVPTDSFYGILLNNVSSSLDISFEFYDSTYTLIGGPYNSGGAGGNEEMFSTYLLTGTYYIKVIGDGVNPGIYDAFVYQGDLFEPNDSFGTASAIVINDPAQNHSLDTATDIDYIQFDVIDPVDYNISIAGVDPAVDISFSLYDSAFALVSGPINSAGVGADEILTAIALTAQTYYIEVQAANSAIGTYSIVVEKSCGNGVVEGAETCDDGNNIDGDFCSATCQIGDGIIGFESGMPAGFTGSWYVTSTTASAGTLSMRANVIGNSSSTCNDYVITGYSSVFFDYSTSSESLDRLSFYINGALKFSLGGNIPWTTSLTYALTGATDTVRWCYVKDGSVSIGSDTVYVDEINFIK
ncbi:MAG: hypothetical protein OEZ22_02440 [Spirochaetia bacterium]|nr:hypothetical protein [Spirochaetia bacterium]